YVQSSLRGRFPRDCWTEHEAVHGIAACVFRRDILIFHFYADFQAFVRQENRRQCRLRETPFTSAIAGILLFKKPVHGPFDSFEEILREKQTNFVGIGNLGWAALLFFSCRCRRWNFFVSNGADAEFVLREDCWIERDLVPIRKGPACFQTHCLHTTTAIE